jgi:hypothetical protein
MNRPNYGALAAAGGHQIRRVSGMDIHNHNNQPQQQGIRVNQNGAFFDYQNHQMMDYRNGFQPQGGMPGMGEMHYHTNGVSAKNAFSPPPPLQPVGAQFGANSSSAGVVASNNYFFSQANGGVSGVLGNSGSSATSTLLRSSSGGHQQHHSGIDSGLTSGNSTSSNGKRKLNHH